MRSSRRLPVERRPTSQRRPSVGRVAGSAILCLGIAACSGAGATAPGASPTASQSALVLATATASSIALPSPTMAHDSYQVIAHIDNASVLTATLLANGEVLLVDDLMVARLFDPVLGTMRVLSSPQQGRYNYSATLLLDGRVLVVGGTDGADFPRPSLNFDPTALTRVSTGSLRTGRESHTVTTLTDGRALVVGGDQWNGGAGPTLTSSEIYDPATGEYGATGSLHVARTRHTATRLLDGRVLIAGGSSGSSDPTMAEVYEPNTGLFELAGSMSAARWGHTATLLKEGRVLIAGGEGGSSLASAEIYDPATGSFTKTGSMTSPRGQGASALLADGRVLIVDPSNPSGDLYDPATGTFRATAPMPDGLSGYAAMPLPDGQVLLLASHDYSQNSQFLALYQP
jgi:hypothetical protein